MQLVRLPVLCAFLPALFLASCANEGTIVRKDSRPYPFYHSLGVEGAYTFLLRDQTGVVHRQMVTAEVFDAYAEGQYLTT